MMNASFKCTTSDGTGDSTCRIVAPERQSLMDSHRRSRWISSDLTIAAFAVLCSVVSGQSADLRVSGPTENVNGFVTYTLQSPYQGRATSVEILTPDVMEAGVRYPVLYR